MLAARNLTRLGALTLFAAPQLACLRVDAELPRTCFLQPDVSIEAVEVEGITAQGAFEAAEAAGIQLPDNLPPVAVEQTFTRDGLSDIPRAIDELGAEASLSLLFVDVSATAGLDSFDSIGRIGVLLRPTDPASGLEPQTLALCDRSQGCDVSGATVTLAGDAQRDLLPYLRAGELEFTLQLEGRPPLEAWAFDVDVCMQGDGAYEYRL